MTSYMTHETISSESILNDKWCLWYHNPEDKNWKINSYDNIYTFNSIERFWKLHNSMKDGVINSGMFFLMRKGIFPIWEDKHNIHGGCWSYKIPKKNSHDAWIDLSVRLIAEQLCNNSSSVNGISISPKKEFCVIKVWNQDSKKRDDATLLINDSEHFKNNPSKYSVFLEQK